MFLNYSWAVCDRFRDICEEGYKFTCSWWLLLHQQTALFLHDHHRIPELTTDTPFPCSARWRPSLPGNRLTQVKNEPYVLYKRQTRTGYPPLGATDSSGQFTGTHCKVYRVIIEARDLIDLFASSVGQFQATAESHWPWGRGPNRPCDRYQFLLG